MNKPKEKFNTIPIPAEVHTLVADQPPPKTKLRNRNMVQFEVIEAIRRDIGMDEGEFVQALGYANRGAYNQWRTEGEVPTTTFLAAKHLESLSKPKIRTALYLCIVPPEKIMAFLTMMDAMHLPYNDITPEER